MDCRKSLAPLCKYFLLLFILATIVDIFSYHCCLLLIKIVGSVNNVSDTYLQTQQDRGGWVANWPCCGLFSLKVAVYGFLYKAILIFPCMYIQVVGQKADISKNPNI